jgi:glycosyltransferase involved in cell wall biosynthesis
MRIGFLTSEYPHKLTSSSAGLGTSIKNLAVSLIREGIKVSIFIYGQGEDKQFTENGISFHLIKQKKYKVLGWYLYRKQLQNYINRQIKKEKIDLIEAHDWTGITAFMKFSCPSVIRVNGSDAYFCHLDGRRQKPKNRFFEKKALKSVSAIVSVSAYAAKITKEIFGLKVSIPVIPNSLDVELFLPSAKPVVKDQLLYFGTLIRKKGVLELAHIFNEIIKKKPEAMLLLIGKDVVDIFEKKSTLKLFFQRLTPEAKKQITHFPEVGYEEIQQYIATSKVVLLPSFAEALPMAWLEAMAMGKALVTSNIGWAKEVMTNGETGFTEDPKDHFAYAGKVLQLLDNPDLAERMGKAARQQVIEKFSTEVVVKQNISFFENILKNKNG